MKLAAIGTATTWAVGRLNLIYQIIPAKIAKIVTRQEFNHILQPNKTVKWIRFAHALT